MYSWSFTLFSGVAGNGKEGAAWSVAGMNMSAGVLELGHWSRRCRVELVGLGWWEGAQRVGRAVC